MVLQENYTFLIQYFIKLATLARAYSRFEGIDVSALFLTTLLNLL